MSRIIFFCVALMMARIGIGQPSTVGPLAEEQVWGLLESTFTDLPIETEIALAWVQGDTVRYLGARKEGKGALIRLDNRKHIFEIGSVTKVLTTQLLVHAVLEEKIESLDSPVQAYLDFTLLEGDSITFRDLVSHQSGISNEIARSVLSGRRNPYASFGKEELKEHLKQTPPVFLPGSQYQYSNVGMALLGHVLSEVYGQPYEKLLEEVVFQPLAMSHSRVGQPVLPDLLVSGLNHKGKPTDNWTFGALAGAGGVLSCVEDLSAYAGWSFDALTGDSAVMTEPIRAVTPKTSVALGWHQLSLSDQAPFLWHSGGTGGYSAGLALRPEARQAVVVLSNVSSINNPKKKAINRLAYELMAEIEK